MMGIGGEQRQEQRISIPVILVFALDIWQEKIGKFVILWIDLREEIFPLHYYSESESNLFRDLQIFRFFPARYPKQRQE